MSNPTGILFADPQAKPLSTTGLPQAAAYYLFFLTGTTTPANVYADGALTTPLSQTPGATQPSCTADSAGRFNPIYLNPTTTYRVQLFSAINVKLEDTDPYVVPGIANQATIGGILYPQTAAEIAASVVPVNFVFPSGNVNRYATNTTPGSTDMTTAFNNALLSNGRIYAPTGTYLIASQLTMQNNTMLYGDGSATVLNFSSVGNLDFILGTSIINATVSDMKLVASGVSTANNYQGVVAFRLCTNCRAERLEIVGAYAIGIEINACSLCVVEDNYLHGWQGTFNDSADIHVSSTVAVGGTENVVSNNRCMGGGYHGISVQNFLTSGLPVTKNLVLGNRVGQHMAYGILLYDAAAAGVDCWNEAIGNYVENIQGNVITGNSGAGIYLANQGACTIANNIIRNCCVQTSAATLAPGGIGVTCQAQAAPFTITGNSIFDMAQGNANAQPISGIYIAGPNTKGGTISGNTVSQQISGGINFGIFSQTASDVQISGNNVNILNTIANTRGIYASAPNGTVVANITISGNTVVGCNHRGISADQTGSGTFANLAITGNSVSGWANGGIGMEVVVINQVTMNGNVLNGGAGTGVALNVSASTNMAIAGNAFVTGGTTSVTTVGACTNSRFDLSNYFNNAIINSATGFRVEFFFNASPATLGGLSAFGVGDRCQQLVPVVGSPKGWLCTVAGNNGTWVSEGNL